MTAPDEPGVASSDFALAVGDLSQAYYSIPAGQPTTEQVMDRLPALYAAIEAVLDSAGRYGGLIATVADADRRGVPVYITTEARAASASVPPLDRAELIALRVAIENEVAAAGNEPKDPFEQGAVAAYQFALSLLPDAAYAAETPEQGRGDE